MAGRKKRGQQTVVFDTPPTITAWASVVGPKEGQGPWGQDFDVVMSDYIFGEKTWEIAEYKMMRGAIERVLDKRNFRPEDAELLLAGDLLNQIVASNFAARDLEIPFLGLYGACSTMAEGLTVGAMLMDGGYFDRIVAAACSHHYTAERQYRFPTEQGVQKPQTAQWTATAAGSVLLESRGSGPYIKAATVGKVIDMGQTDASDMGSAMAGAAVHTIKTHLDDLNLSADYYDLIVTGDLGKVGSAIARQLFVRDGIIEPNYSDCGVLLYDQGQAVGSGGSGCGCSACMLCGPLLKKMQNGELQKLLLVCTGALMSPITSFQGESIPSIAHAVAIEMY